VVTSEGAADELSLLEELPDFSVLEELPDFSVLEELPELSVLELPDVSLP
jgi:hypothetical protein